MGDADGAEGAEQDFDFELDESFAPGTDIAEGMREAAFGYRSDPFSGELRGGDKGVSKDGVTVAPELSATGEGATDIKPEKEKPAEVKEPAKPPEKKPAITRAKRRRSLLTEEEGGVLRKPTVYRRSILGR